MSLAARVRAVNRCHFYAVQLHARLAEVFRPLVGRKVANGLGALTNEVEDLMPRLPSLAELWVRRWSDAHSLVWTVKTPMTFGDHTYYREAQVFVGSLKGGVLVSLNPPPDLRCDYTEEWVIETRGAYKAAREAARSARASLVLFGETL